jgi:hypothetical protein
MTIGRGTPIGEISQSNLLALAATRQKSARIKERQDVLQSRGSPFVPLDPARLPPKVTKTIVVTQNPAAGTDVPLGTTVELKLAVKEQLPITSLAASAVLAEKFKTAGELTTILAADNRSAVRKVLEANPDYGSLEPADKAVADAFIAEQFGAGISVPDRSMAYDDIAFIFAL